MLKKIDMESKGYQRFRGAFSNISAAGTIWTYEAVVLPFVQAVWSGNKLGRLMRLACYAGIISTGTVIGLVSKGYSETVVDTLAEGYNALLEKPKVVLVQDFISWYNEKAEENEEPSVSIDVDEHVKNMTPEEELEYVHKYVEERKLFEFTTEEEARRFAEKLIKNVNEFGFDDLGHIAFNRSADNPTCSEYSILILYGWTKNDIQRIGVDKISDNEYIVDAFNYHNISDFYKTL